MLFQYYRFSLLLCVVSIFSAVAAYSAGYVKFEGVDGGAQEENYFAWSELESFSQVIHRRSSQHDLIRRQSTPVLEDLVVVKFVDKASPKLAEAVLKERLFPKVEMHLTTNAGDGRQVPYLVYELKNVRVTGYSISGAGERGAIPAEYISLNFEEIRVVYKEMDSDGSSKGDVEYTWKVEEGKK